MSRQTRRTNNQHVFDSVFPPGNPSQPTSVTHPTSPFPGMKESLIRRIPKFPEAPFSDIRDSVSRQPPPSPSESKHIRDESRWSRDWRLVTTALLLPGFPKTDRVPTLLRPEKELLDGAFDEALENVLYPQTRLPHAGHTEDLIAWYTSEVRSHFLHQVLPIILPLKARHSPELLIQGVVRALRVAHRQYLHGFGIIMEQIDTSARGTSKIPLEKFHRDLHAVISNSLMTPLGLFLRKLLSKYVFATLGLPSGESSGAFLVTPQGHESEAAHRDILNLVKNLACLGLAGVEFQYIFGEVMNHAMTQYVHQGCKGLWSSEDKDFRKTLSDVKGSELHEDMLLRTAHHSSPSQCATDICEWIENRYSALVVDIINIVDVDTKITWVNQEKYKEMALGHLADLRINELFDLVVNWPNSSGALDDLRMAITTPQRRLHLTENFIKILKEKLLHPGTSTLQILQTYISMIWTFHSLDNSKVLLDRVSYPLKLYLCSREDTVRIIITGLLADTDSEGNPVGPGGEKLIELAQLLNSANLQVETRANDEELDWHDMDWVPDPVDAGPGYKRSKNADIIGTLVGALGAQDVFIKEFQSIIGEHLLRQDMSVFGKEIKVLELLKSKFGEAPLQACEVMLKDIQDSLKVDAVIRKKNRGLEPSEEEMHAAYTNYLAYADHMPYNEFSREGRLRPSLHAKILSRLFWPLRQEDSYRVPDPIIELQNMYEEGFESLKNARKLTWLHALGQVTVELELEDRTIVEEVHTWQATVIWAFHDEGDNEALQDNDPGVYTVEELVESLEMEEPLVRSALKFWVSKLVLHENPPNTFTVLETLNQEDRARSNAQATASAQNMNDESTDDTNILANEAIATERMQVYWQFIQGMLKSSRSQMPLQQIAMMLKISIADGFPYGNEELQEFLNGKVAGGELEISGGKYKLKK